MRYSQELIDLMIGCFKIFLLSSLTISVSLVIPIEDSVLITMILVLVVLQAVNAIEGLKYLYYLEMKGEK